MSDCIIKNENIIIIIIIIINSQGVFSTVIQGLSSLASVSVDGSVGLGADIHIDRHVSDGRFLD